MFLFCSVLYKIWNSTSHQKDKTTFADVTSVSSNVFKKMTLTMVYQIQVKQIRLLLNNHTLLGHPNSLNCKLSFIRVGFLEIYENCIFFFTYILFFCRHSFLCEVFFHMTLLWSANISVYGLCSIVKRMCLTI